MWSTSARGFQRAKQTATTEAGAPVPAASSGTAVKPAQQRGPRAAGPAPPPPAQPKARGHPAPPAAGKPARRATTPSPTKPRHNGGGSIQQQAARQTSAAAPAQQNLKQAAAQARTERLRNALQQLLAGRGVTDGSAVAGGHGGEAAVQPLRASASTAAPALQHPPPPQAAAAAAAQAAPTACTASCEPEPDSDLEDLFDDVSLDLLARLRLGGQRAALPAAPAALPSGTPMLQLQQQAAGADVLAAARRALHEAAAEPEMPVLRHGTCAITAHAAAVPLDAGTAAPTAQGGVAHSAAAMQQQLERLRSSLSAAPSLPLPPPPAVQPGGSAGRSASVSPGGERRAELVLTRPPSRQAAELPPAMPAAQASGSRAVVSAAFLAAPPTSPYSSSGATPAARLAALLVQPAGQPPAPPALHPGHAPLQLSRPAALGQPGWPDHGYSSAQQLVPAPPAPGMLSLGAQPALIRHAAVGTAPAAGSRAAVARAPTAGSRAAVARAPTAPVATMRHSSAAVGSSTTTWRAGGLPAPPGQAGDILAEWRARRQQLTHGHGQPVQQQGSSLADRYSRFLSLRQPEGAAAPGLGAAAAAVAAAAAGRQAGPEALQLGGRLGRPHAAAAAGTTSSSSSNGGARPSLQMTEPEGGDILARWRARRRQQAQAGCGSGADDLTPLLTLRMPGAAAHHAVVPRRPPAGAECHAAGTSPVRQPAAGNEHGWPRVAGGSSGESVGQLVLAAPPLPPVAVRSSSSTCSESHTGPPPARPSSNIGPTQVQPSLQLSSAVPAPAGAPAVLRSVGTTVAEQLSATVALAAVPQQLLQGTGCRAAEQAADPREAVASSQPAAEPPQSKLAAAAVSAELALVLPAAPAADECEPAICQQPSRPPSAASSGRATPLSSLALTSCGSAAWSPGISRLLDECIGGYFAGGCSSVLELAGEAGSGKGSSQEEAEAIAAAGAGAASSSGGRRGVGMASAVDGSGSTPEEACPDPADLPFLSAAASPAACCGKRSPPGDGVVATARALLAEAVMLLDQPGGARHSALLAILEFVDRLKPEDRETLLAVLDGYLLPSGRRWVDDAGLDQVALEEEAALAAVLSTTALQDERTLVHQAARMAEATLLQKLLIAARAAALLADKWGHLALHDAAEAGSEAAVQCLLLAAPSAVTAASQEGDLAIHLAVEHGHAAAMQCLLEAAPATAMAASRSGFTPLHLAARSGSELAVQCLLQAAPAVATVATSDGSLPLHQAAASGSPAVFCHVLAAAPAAAQQADSEGALPIHYAAGRDGCLPVTTAAAPGYLEVLRAALAAAPDSATALDNDGYTALHYAAYSHGLAGVALVLEAAPESVNVVTANGRTVLHEAAGNDPAVVSLLLGRNPAAALQADADGRTPLFFGSDATAALLLAAAPAAAALVDADGQHALHYHTTSRRAGAVRLLLDAHPPAAQAADEWGRTPLHYAVFEPEITRQLLHAAPECAMQPDEAGQLPLHMAADVCVAPIIAAMLAAAPAAAAVHNSSGQLPLQVAMQAHGDRWPNALRALVAATPAQEALAALAAAERPEAALPLFAHVVCSTALLPEDWELVPSPCPGLEAALPAVHARSRTEAALLVRRLPAAAQARLRTAALALARALPANIYEHRILPFVAQ